MSDDDDETRAVEAYVRDIRETADHVEDLRGQLAEAMNRYQRGVEQLVETIEEAEEAHPGEFSVWLATARNTQVDAEALEPGDELTL